MTYLLPFCQVLGEIFFPIPPIGVGT
jgi:hypothetical protein